MDWMPVVWATVGASFSALCFGAYARHHAVDGSFDWDLVIIATVATWLGILAAIRPQWVW